MDFIGNKGSVTMKVRKAVIPAAGLGTRLFPATKIVKKEFFPIIDTNEVAKPVIQLNVEEALSAGIEEIAIIIQPDDEPLFQSYFSDLSNHLYPRFIKTEQQVQLLEALKEMGQRITYIPQAVQEGFGHAVYCAREWVAGEPFLLILGDHLFCSTVEISCAKQLINIYEKYGHTVSGVDQTHVSRLKLFGTVTGSWIEQAQGLFLISHLYEKPDAAYAQEHLMMPGLPSDIYFCFFGMHVFSYAIFEMLEYQIKHNIREKGEFQLTSAQERLRKYEGKYYGLEIRGKRFDMGVPLEYKKTISLFGAAISR